jgi:LPXTG-motif cell wall-anchored protein
MHTRTRRFAGLTTLAIGATAVVGGLFAAPASAAETRDATTYIGKGNVTCLAGQGGVDGLGYQYEAKFDGVPEGDVSVPVGAAILAEYPGLEIEITDAAVVAGVFTMSWNATQDDEAAPVISAVILKQGNDAVVYTYDPTAASGTGLNTAGLDQQGGISHVSFCLNDPPETTTVPEETTTTVEETTTTVTPTTPTTAAVLPTTLVREAATTTTAAQVLGVQLPRTGGGNGHLALLGVGLLMVGAGAVFMADDWRRLVARKA